jgi:hypothetical protein
MSDATPSELQRLLAQEFERRGWHYDLTVGRELVKEIEQRHEVDPQALAKRVPTTYLAQNRATWQDVALAIEAAVGGRTPRRGMETPATLVINDNRYSLNLGAGAEISGGAVNVGSTQINVQVNASKDDVLAAVSALVASGLAGGWNADAASELAQVIDARADIRLDDVERVTREVAETNAPDAGRVRTLLTAIATSTISGVLGTGISAGLGQILAHLPF